MKRVGILTDFGSHDPAYSLCAVVANQAKQIAGWPATVFVRKGFKDWWLAQETGWDSENGKMHVTQEPSNPYADLDIVELDPGDVGNNTVEVTPKSRGQIDALAQQMVEAFEGLDVVMTHDMIYQPNMWKYHVAARRVAERLPGLRWLHWVHSATPMSTAKQTGPFAVDLRGPMARSRLVVMSREETVRKAEAFGYLTSETAFIPNPIDLEEGMHPIAQDVIARLDLWKRDCIAVYPCRLDRGKQPHVVVEIMAHLRALGWDVAVVIVDFHSTAGDKAAYRDEIRNLAEREQVPTLFTSDLGGDAAYHIPHKAVLDLFEYGDVLIHPSRSECDSMILQEAMWMRCGCVLNFDLPVFRQYDGLAAFGKFSSNVDAMTGQPGETNTDYADRPGYMRHMAGLIADMMAEPGLALHRKVRQERSLQANWGRHLMPVLEGSERW